jgi:hypothetical protein
MKVGAIDQFESEASHHLDHDTLKIGMQVLVVRVLHDQNSATSWS